MFKKEKCEKNKKERKRGRPIGKNRVPLSLEERRARNAQYERERRNETADALLQLAQVAGCKPTTTNADILATVISQIQQAAARGRTESLDNIKRCNDSLRAQIHKLQNDLRGISNVDLSEFHDLMSESDEEKDYRPTKKKIKTEPESSWDPEYFCLRKKNVNEALKVERSSPIQETESDYSLPEENPPPTRTTATVETYPEPNEETIINAQNSQIVEAGIIYSELENFVLNPENSSPTDTNIAYFQTEEPEDSKGTTIACLSEQEFLRPDETMSWPAADPEVEVLMEPACYAPAIQECWGYETESQWTPPDPFIGAPVPLVASFQMSQTFSLLSESPLQSSESESPASSPVDLDSVLGTLTAEEKRMLSGVVKQMDHSSVLGL